MPQTISLYKLFLASPSDVKEERLIVENVINDFNNTYSSQLNARIELCSWEKSSYPSVGEYPQAVINSQIGDEYDIFLGILWTRFGSKTLNYESGTEEEFYRALERSQQAGKVHIMMYFNIEGVPLDSLDIEHIGPMFEKKEIFPEQVNTEFIQVVSRDVIKMRVWERGSGETLACGTGACASVVACVLNGLTEDKVTVKLLGGDLFIEYNRDEDAVYMTGPARITFTGEFNY